VVLDQDQGGGRVVGDVGQHVPGLLVAEHLDAVGGGLGPLGQALLALDAEPDQSPDLAAQLSGLVQGEVAEVGDLELTLGVLVDGQGVDHPDGVAVAQPLQLLDDLAMEVGMVEPRTTKAKPGCWTRRRTFDQVRHGSNIQLLSFSLVRAARARRPCGLLPRAGRLAAQSRPQIHRQESSPPARQAGITRSG
jgi:hypothetical protein